MPLALSAVTAFSPATERSHKDAPPEDLLQRGEMLQDAPAAGEQGLHLTL